MKDRSGFESQQFDFSALGDEAFLPLTHTYNNAVFAFEEVGWDKVRLQFGGRFEYQTVDADSDPNFGPASSRNFPIGSGWIGIVYSPVEPYSAALPVSYSQRAPTYEKLYATARIWRRMPLKSAIANLAWKNRLASTFR